MTFENSLVTQLFDTRKQTDRNLYPHLNFAYYGENEDVLTLKGFILKDREAVLVNTIRLKKHCLIIRRVNLATNKLIKQGICPVDITYSGHQVQAILEGIVVW